MTIFSLTLLICIVTFTFSARINIGASNDVEFGQGVLQTVACDTYITTSLKSTVDPTTGTYYLKELMLGDLSVQLHDKTISVELVGDDGSILNSNLSFDIGSDGLTFTSTRTHVDVLDAFTDGLGPKAEFGSSQITFTSIDTEETNRIPSSSIKHVALQTSGSGSCTTPSNVKAVEVYVDAPYVQGSYIPELYPVASLVDNYNNSVVTSGANCPSSGTVGTYSTGDCRILFRNHNNVSYPFGGALTTTSTPTTGGAASDQSPSAAVYTANGLTITFATRKNYVGFWWSAGSLGNSIKFYRGNALVATITGDDVYNAIPKNSSTLTARNGTTQYTKSNYYGHPLNTSTMDPAEPFVYFHCFAVNGFNFDKVVLATTGNGFEYDNFTVSNLSGDQLTPKNTLVFISSYNYSG